VKRVIALASFVSLALAAPAGAARTVHEVSWSALKSEGLLLGGDVVPPSGDARSESLRVTNADGAPRTVPLFALEAPGVKAPRYLLRGDVRGEGIEGQAYLEMWSFFAGGGRYFSRTLAPAGPMGTLSGTFARRPFILPFTAEAGMAPEKLVVNVAFPGRGTVILGPLRLVELEPGDDFAVPPGAWLSARQIARAGAVGGTLLGLLGAAAGILASKGRARGLVVGLLWAMLVLGMAALAAAALAWKSGQPGELLTLLVLVGILGSALPAGLLGKVKRQYDEQELRRMKALDAG
jgi:hypothetical protein